ncbi:MAG TPA: hypothetical protein VEA15_00990 [Caulobacteraceae bacterium]|nr:hypothetical protein [Caulobacteraceae bacterium]
MMQDDFASVAADAPLYGSPGLLENPWFWLTAVAIGVMIAIFSAMGARQHLRDQLETSRKGACEGIWKAINDKARTAASAPRHQVPAAAQVLANEVTALLGPVVALAPLGGKAKALLEALDGKPAKHDKHHGEGGHDKPAHDSVHEGHGPSEPAHGENTDHGDAGAHSAASASNSGSHIHINIGDRHHAAAAHTPAATHKPEPHKPAGPRDAIDVDAVRAAVLAFTDYWSHRETIVGQLQAAQIALLRTPPSKDAHGAFKHGG